MSIQGPMAGRTVIVTGATSGIGQACASELAGMGARVIAIGRNPARAQETLAAIRAAHPGAEIESALADLSSQAATRALAAELLERCPRIDVLVNNAGGIYSHREETSDGIELTFALNHLAYFLLTDLLLDRLTASAPARIVSVASSGERLGRLHFDDLQYTRRYSAAGAYNQSKLANIVFTYELARRLEGMGVTATVMHPGPVRTGWGRNNRGLVGLGVKLAAPFLRTPEKGAETVTWLASSPEVEGASGLYYHDRKVVRSRPESFDPAIGQRLWEASAALIPPKM